MSRNSFSEYHAIVTEEEANYDRERRKRKKKKIHSLLFLPALLSSSFHILTCMEWAQTKQGNQTLRQSTSWEIIIYTSAL